MKRFSCVCGNRIFFENTECIGCGRRLGYLPASGQLVALQPNGDGTWLEAEKESSQRWRECAHFTAMAPCNWMVEAGDAERRCRACRLTAQTGDLQDARVAMLWARTESAKRRLIYTLDRLSLPVVSRAEDARGGLAFALLMPEGDNGTIMTGHLNGLITLSLLEADDAAREQVRIDMQERYRTLLGHFRHEVGHYYHWRLVQDRQWEAPFRALFGDERADYAAALEAYYRDGPPADWNARYVSAYASSHPLEDFAECFAHALHMTEALETAQAFGFIPPLPEPGARGSFDQRLRGFMELGVGLNALSRSLGLNDPYPFVLPVPVHAKLRLVDEILHDSRRSA